MNIVRLESVSLAFGLKPLLKDVVFSIDKGQRYCLLGRNGEGKSSLLKVLQGIVEPDSGQVIVQKGTKIGFLPQDIPEEHGLSVGEVVACGAGDLGKLLAEFDILAQETDAASLERLSEVQNKIEALDGWSLQNKIDALLNRFSLNRSQAMGELSGGWRRRALLAKALVMEPDLLLLDEPTNHLDINAIRWLEQQLSDFPGALLFVSHDRAFIKKLASEIIELDRGVLSTFKGDYDSYLVAKEKRLEDEAKQNQLFDKKLSEEETWIRQGIKARRTRNEGRVRALKAMRSERSERVSRQGSATIKIEEGAASGKLVIQLKNVSHGFEVSKPLVSNFSTTVIRGDRIGLLGVNGAGKTTLLRILLGQLEPNEGEVKLGSKMEVSYFDQLRGGLNPEKSVFDNVADGHEYVELGGKSKHVMSYLNDFLFTSERARTPVKALSGGETNRLLLARLFSKACNVIVLDEPTNDLDVDTLELLEEKLNEFKGTLLITSHDRQFLDNVVTSTMVFEGGGKVGEYVGGYDDWVRQTGGELADESAFRPINSNEVKEKTEPPKQSAVNDANKASAPLKKTKKKLSYKLQLELDELPEKVEGLETEQEKLEAEISSPGFFERDRAEVEEKTARLKALEEEIATSMERWLELEELSEG